MKTIIIHDEMDKPVAVLNAKNDITPEEIIHFCKQNLLPNLLDKIETITEFDLDLRKQNIILIAKLSEWRKEIYQQAIKRAMDNPYYEDQA